MREIKFRAWDKHTQKMYSSMRMEQVMKLGKYNLKSLVWQQYTGLLDKNGVEIYEGDIGYAVRTKDNERVKIDFGMAHAYIDYLHGPFEVIGNIYENPELLHETNPKKA